MSKSLLNLTFRALALCAALALLGCIMVIGVSARRASSLEASGSEEHLDEACHEAEEAGEDDTVTENQPRLLS